MRFGTTSCEFCTLMPIANSHACMIKEALCQPTTYLLCTSIAFFRMESNPSTSRAPRWTPLDANPESNVKYSNINVTRRLSASFVFCFHFHLSLG